MNSQLEKIQAEEDAIRADLKGKPRAGEFRYREMDGVPIGFYTFQGAGSSVALSNPETPPAPVLPVVRFTSQPKLLSPLLPKARKSSSLVRKLLQKTFAE